MFEWRGTRSCRSSRWGEAVKLSRYDFPIPKNDFRTKPVGFFNLENETVPPKRPGAQEDYLWKWQVERTMVLSTLAHPCICHLEGDWLKHQLQWLFGPFFGDLRQQFFLLCSYNTPKSSPTRPSWWLMWMFWLQSQSPRSKKNSQVNGVRTLNPRGARPYETPYTEDPSIQSWCAAAGGPFPCDSDPMINAACVVGLPSFL